MTETGERQVDPNEEYAATLMADALHWLDVVGRYDHEIPKPDTPYNRANSNALRYLGDRMAEEDIITASLLACLERQARLATSDSFVSDAEMQDTVRVNTFYGLARIMNRFAGEPYDNTHP